jgi:hypothetical protein
MLRCNDATRGEKQEEEAMGVTTVDLGSRKGSSQRTRNFY